MAGFNGYRGRRTVSVDRSGLGEIWMLFVAERENTDRTSSSGTTTSMANCSPKEYKNRARKRIKRVIKGITSYLRCKVTFVNKIRERNESPKIKHFHDCMLLAIVRLDHPVQGRPFYSRIQP